MHVSNNNFKDTATDESEIPGHARCRVYIWTKACLKDPIRITVPYVMRVE